MIKIFCDGCGVQVVSSIQLDIKSITGKSTIDVCNECWAYLEKERTLALARLKTDPKKYHDQTKLPF